MLISARNILFILSIILFTSCSDQGAQQESDQALQDYRTFVTKVEEDTTSDISETEWRAMQQSKDDDSAWETESKELMQQNDERKRRVVQNIDMYNETEQQELRDLEERYNQAYEKQKQKHQEVSRRYKLRNDLLGLNINADDMSSITASDLPETYNRFVQSLKAKTKELKGEDWDLVEGWWSALNNRKRTLENELSASDKKIIEQATQEYRQIRQQPLLPQ